MVIPKILKPSYWVDIFLTLFLKIVLAILLKTLYYIKGEEVRVSKVEEEFENHHEIACPPLEIRTSHSTNRNNHSDILPFEFKWKHGGNDVTVTGDFDNWQCTHKMKYNPLSNDFVAVVDIDRTKQHEFKFVVDGMWQPNWDLPTQTDEHGNVNNVIYGLPSSPLNTEFREYSAPFSQFAAAC
ncbi:1243_t:CDS:2 [Funneliformis caledonium]|uniref:1243_t:CDS:1 n=1 Tax=Funneliformis caledonium TaxID=1117310 RepID=A0A9N9F193_9GLOM|nr:1243_t:CDS:2 [Funneliformis caledonium]